MRRKKINFQVLFFTKSRTYSMKKRIFVQFLFLMEVLNFNREEKNPEDPEEKYGTLKIILAIITFGCWITSMIFKIIY